MARSPSDATRFTATGPYASSSPGFSSNPAPSGPQISFGASAPEGETAQQKISRLRAAATTAKRGKESRFDSVVRVGRVWADRAHRFTAIGLISLTAISGMVATAGITDMIMHNRRRRAEFFAEQRAKSARDLAEAKAAMDEGRATDDHILLINRERAADEADAAKRNRPGVFKRTTNWLFNGLSEEEQKGGRLGVGAAGTSAGSQLQAPQSSAEQEDRGVLQAVEDKVASNRRQAERVEETLRPLGGPLDREAQSLANATSDTGRSRTSWVTGR